MMAKNPEPQNAEEFQATLKTAMNRLAQRMGNDFMQQFSELMLTQGPPADQLVLSAIVGVYLDGMIDGEAASLEPGEAKALILEQLAAKQERVDISVRGSIWHNAGIGRLTLRSTPGNRLVPTGTFSIIVDTGNDGTKLLWFTADDVDWIMVATPKEGALTPEDLAKLGLG